MAKAPCPITREAFMANAKAESFQIAGSNVTAEPKQFSTGSFGWYYSGKVTIEVNGQKLPVQVGCNMTVVGSKTAD